MVDDAISDGAQADLASPVGEVDWELVWRIERDICFLYHELSEWPGIRGDLDYGPIYSLPYWEYLAANLPQMPREKFEFVRDGCLVMILSMAYDLIDGSGTYLREYLDRCREIVGAITAQDEKIEKLVHTVLFALDTARTGPRWDKRIPELDSLSVWVNRTYIQGYFRSMLEQSILGHQRLSKSV